MSHKHDLARSRQKRVRILDRFIIRCAWYFLIGAALFTLFWIPQSVTTGIYPFELTVLTTPLLVGGTAGLVVGLLLRRSKKLSQRLSASNMQLREDIERRKQIEAELLIKKQSLSSLINAFAIIDLDGRTSWVNPSFLKMWRLDDGLEVAGRKFAEFWNHPESMDDVFRRVELSGKWSGELVARTKDGKRFDAAANLSYVVDESGKPVCFVASFLDVSGRKRSEAKLRESEERFRGVFEHATVGLYRTTPDGEILLANPALIKMLGYDSFEDLAKINLENDGFMSDKSRDEFKRIIEKDGVARGLEFTWEKKDGTPIYVRESARAIRDQSGSTLYYEGTIEDITERKLAEQNLLEGEERFRNMVEMSEAGYFFVDKKGCFQYVNEAWLRMHKYERRDEVIGRHFRSVIAGSGDKRPEGLAQYLFEESELSSGEMIRICKDGTIGYQLFSINAVEEGGEVTGAEGFLIDITDRKIAERELERRLEREELLTTISNLFVNCDESEIDSAIDAALRHLGEFQNADRAYVFSIEEDGSTTYMTHEWCAEGIEPDIHRLQGFSIAEYRFFIQNLRQGKPVILGNLSELPPDAIVEKENLEIGSVKSIAIAPILIRDKLAGIIGIDGVHNEVRWTDEDVRLLTTASRMITLARKRAEATRSLMESERRLKAVVSNIPDSAVLLFDHDMRFLLAEGPELANNGYSPEGILGHTLEEVFRSKILDSSRGHFEAALDGKASRGLVEIRDRTFLFTASPVRDENGDVIAGVVLIQNITDQQKSQEALRLSEERFRQLAESIDQIYWVCEVEENRLTYISPKFINLFGFSPDEKYRDRLTWLELVHESDRERVEEFFQKQSTGFEGELEYRIVRADGLIRWVRDRAYPIFTDDGKLYRLTGVMEDISERKRVQIELKQSEATLRQILDLVPHYIHAKNKSLEFILANRAVAESFGMLSEELVGRNHAELAMDIEEAEKTLRSDLEVIEGGEPRFIPEERYTDVHGEVHWLESIKVPFIHFGEPAVLVVAIDITDRKRAEEALRESEEKFRQMAELAPEGIFETDENGVIMFANQTALAMFGYSREDLEIGLTTIDMVAPDERDQARAKMNETLTVPEPRVSEYTAIRKDGSLMPVRVHIRPILSGEKITGLRGVISDMTDWRKNEAERLKSQKLESLGVLAGGIAHDFNNILTGVLGNITLAQMIVPEDSELYEILLEAEKATERASGLTQQLLTFSKGGAPIREEAQVSELIAETARFVTAGSNVRCDFDIADDLMPVEADIAQISQVVHNLVINADQAMPKGGIVRIIARNVNVEDNEVESLKPGSYVRIEVRDSGVGIPPENISRIFDPFFTTKSRGEGLGLSTAYSVVKKHEGHIEVESQVGEGSMFAVYLPVSREIPAETKSTAERDSVDAPRILLMDDDKLVSKFARTVLERRGYRVTVTSDGREAALVYQEEMEKGKPFSVVLLDLTVPGGTGGAEALELLKEIDPNVTAIASSGYSIQNIGSGADRSGFAGFVAKPYKPNALIREIERFLPASRQNSRV